PTSTWSNSSTTTRSSLLWGTPVGTEQSIQHGDHTAPQTDGSAYCPTTTDSGATSSPLMIQPLPTELCLMQRTGTATPTSKKHRLSSPNSPLTGRQAKSSNSAMATRFRPKQ